MFLFLTLLWIIFNGRFTVEILVFGLIISAAVCFFMVRFFGYSFKKELLVLKILPDLLFYVIILLVEIIKANFTVMKMIIFKAKSIEPTVVHFHTDLKTKAARVLLANSITLTPGTITSSMHEDEFYVHCLDKHLSVGISDSVFVRRLRKMENRIL